MAQLAKGALRKKAERLALALRGNVEEHHRFMLRIQLDRVERIEEDVAVLDARIDDALAPHREVVDRLKTIPGVDRVAAITIIAELGVDMTVFPSARHAAAWAGLCPSNNESAGKRMAQTKRKGNVHLSTALIQAGMSAARAKDTYLKARFWKISARRGKKRAAVAVGHTILVAAYEMLARGEDDKDLGPDYLDRYASRRTEKQLVRRLEALGYQVAKPAA